MSEQLQSKPTATKAKNVSEKRWHCDFCPATAKAIQRRDRHKCANSQNPTYTPCHGDECLLCIYG